MAGMLQPANSLAEAPDNDVTVFPPAVEVSPSCSTRSEPAGCAAGSTLARFCACVETGPVVGRGQAAQPARQRAEHDAPRAYPTRRCGPARECGPVRGPPPTADPCDRRPGCRVAPGSRAASAFPEPGIELGGIGRRRIDEPSIAGRVVVEPNGLLRLGAESEVAGLERLDQRPARFEGPPRARRPRSSTGEPGPPRARRRPGKRRGIARGRCHQRLGQRHGLGSAGRAPPRLAAAASDAAAAGELAVALRGSRPGSRLPARRPPACPCRDRAPCTSTRSSDSRTHALLRTAFPQPAFHVDPRHEHVGELVLHESLPRARRPGTARWLPRGSPGRCSNRGTAWARPCRSA